MRKLAFLCTFVFMAGLAVAQEPPGQQPPGQQPPMTGQQPAPAAKAGATKELAAQVVSTDPVGKTITIKKDSFGGASGAAGETTLPVESDAVSALKTVMPGEKVKLTCRTDSGGKETAVTAIRKDDKPKTNPLEQP
jgi:hypothetical protein